jgi:small subunit ribosomal protein S9
LTEEPDQAATPPVDEPATGDTTPADEPAGASTSESKPEEPGTRAGSPADAVSEQEPQAETTDDQPVAEEPPQTEATDDQPAADEPPQAESEPEPPQAESEDVAPEAQIEPEAEETSPAPEAASEDAADESTRAPSAETPEATESAPVDEAAPSSAPAGEQPAAEELIEEQPRQKPEIPGADLELIIPEDERQYLDAETLAAAEAEAEAEAARVRAEAEDIHTKPIADAAIDLAAGARYTSTGKRKTAVARVILKPGSGTYEINGKGLNEFFPRETLQRMIRQPLESVGYEARMDVVARMHGGGVSSQAGALRHGISRALIEADPNLRGELKRRGFLTRDPRVKARKKAGIKKARKRPQFSKR